MSPLRILHLEDDTADAALVEALLKADGFDCRVTRAASRQEFVAGLEGGPDLILADYSLPGFDGIAAQRLARDMRPDVPFVFVSGTMGEEVAIDRLKDGATDYVLKHRLQRLGAALRRALAEADERRQRSRAESEVRRLNAELEERVAERTAELAVAKSDAERANRAKNEFLSRMSHDLRTPLNAVIGFAQLLEMDGLTEPQSESVRQILNGGRHLLDLINEVLDIARIEAGQLSLSPEPVPIASVIHQIVDLLAPLGRPRRVSVKADVDLSCAIHVRADQQRLKQVLLNLVGNAVKYNRDDGEVRVSCATRPTGRVVIVVTDTGMGIPEQKLALLFQPFERLGAEQSSVEGTGLGLAVSKALVQAMDGTIGVQSRVGSGTSFWIELPESTPGAAGKPVADVPTVGRAAAPSGIVLYIEDNPANTRLMERVLARRHGVQLITAGSGEAGLRLARGRPNLVFLDLHLPDMSGEEVLSRLAGDSHTADIPVAVLSADATPSQAKRLFASGAIAYLTKPIEVAQVLRLVDERLASPASTVGR